MSGRIPNNEKVFNEGIGVKNGFLSGGFIDLFEELDNGDSLVRIIAPSSLDANYTLTLPPNDGDSTQFLQTDGSGTLTWANASGGGGDGDITGVTAGSGLSGGGDTGAVTLAIDISEYSAVTPANGDSFLTLDSDGSTEQLTTTGALATLFAGDGLSASNSVLSVNVDDSSIEINSDSLRVKANGITLGSHTTGNYVATVADSGTGGITVANSGAESAAVTLEFDIHGLTEATIASGDYIAFSDEGSAGDPSRREKIDDIATLFSGDGLSASSAVMSLDLKSNGGAVIESNKLAVDLGASSITGTLGISNGGTGATSLTNLITLGDHTTGDYVASLTAGTLIDLQNNSGENATPTIDVDLSEASEATIADGDYILFLDGGATGTAAKEAVGDLATYLATLFAGDGLSASSSALSVNVDGSSLETNSDTLRVKANGITDAMLAGSISNGNLANSSITIDGSTIALGGSVATNNTMGAGFVMEDGDGTEVTITENKEIKFIGAGGLTINWSDTDNGTDGDPYDLTFTIGTLNQDTTGTAAIATTVTITDNESTNEDNVLIFAAGGDDDGGNLGLESDGTLTYNPSTGKITATGFIGSLTGDASGSSGSCTGNAATATALATEREINGIGFDGTGNITVPAAGSTLTDTVTVAKGGTNATSFADKAVIISQDSGADTLAALALTGNGHIIVGGSSGPAVEAAADVAGTGLDASVGDGTLALNVAAAQTSITSIINSSLAKIGTADDQEYIDFGTSNKVITYTDGSARLSVSSNGAGITGDLTISGGDLTYGNGQNATIGIDVTAHNAVGKDLSISAGSTTAGTTNNITGGSLTLSGGQGKGSGAGGDISFRVAPAGSSGSSLNSYETAMKLTSAGHLELGGDGKTPLIDMMFDDHSNGVDWDTRINIGKADDFTHGAGALPNKVPSGAYGMSLIANSDGVFYGMEDYGSGNYRPLIRWGDDDADTPFTIKYQAHNGSDTEILKLSYNGELKVANNITAFTSGMSDRRLKDNITTITDPLEKVMRLRGVSFDWNATSRKGKHDIGLIAQEVEEVLPEVVSETNMDVGDFADHPQVLKTVSYSPIVSLLIEAIKHQQTQIDALREKIIGL